MSATINIIETTTELGVEVVEVVVASSSTPGPAGPGVPTGGTGGQVLTKQSATDYDTDWEDATGGPGGGVTDADYLVGTAHAGLSAEIVVGTSPGGELGGTWASPTVDATHSGSSHASVQSAAEATAAAALAAHEADTTSIHGIANTANLYSVGGTDVAVADGGTGASTAAGARANLDLEAGTDFPSLTTFNDHSARHEDGGADEISIAGLSGTSAALQSHLDDTADAHDASAVSVVPFATIAATDVQAALEEIVAEAGGGSGEALQRDINQTGHGLAVGDIVRLNGSTWQKAQANSSTNAEAVGIVAVVIDTDNFTLHYGGRITGLSGLSAGSVYYLDDDTAGLLTTTEPPDAGDVSKPLLIADTTTTGYFFNWRGAINVDMATQAELDAHIGDTSAAHAASAISADSTTLVGTGTDVQAVLEELDNGMADHLADTSDAHDASAISVLDTGTFYTATDVEGVLAEIAPQLGGSVFDPVADIFGTPDTAFEFDTSSFTGLTALSPTPDTEDADTTIPGHYYVQDNASGVAFCGRYATSPSTPFTAITKLDTRVTQDFNLAGMFVGVTTPGAFRSWCTANTARALQHNEFTSPTNSASSAAAGANTLMFPIYLAIVANSNTDIDLIYSMGGTIWTKLVDALNPGITIGSVGIGMASVNANGLAAAFDFLRIWNSAKTFPGVP